MTKVELFLLEWIGSFTANDTRVVLLSEGEERTAMGLISYGLLIHTGSGYRITELGDRYLRASDLERAVMDAREGE